jgi:hypothetical protein
VTARSRLSFTPASRVWRVVALAIVIAGALAVAGTHFTFSNTLDEPSHISAGMRWLSGQHDYKAPYPPLGRIAAAMGPYLRGDRASATAASPADAGAQILGRGEHYHTTLALARLGELPFFFLLCAIVWAWGRRIANERGGAIAVMLAVSNPNLLAHAGLATTDIALAAALTAAFFAYVIVLEKAHWAPALALGISIGLALTSDYAALTVITLGLPAIYGVHRQARGGPLWSHIIRWRRLLAIGLTCVTAALTLWAVYGFELGPLFAGSPNVVPAAGWFHGLASYVNDPVLGHPAFLFGERSTVGWWYYYPVALLVKTPLPLLLLFVLGAAAAVRDLVRRGDVSIAAPMAAAVAILVGATIGADDTGIRLVLPVFAMMPLLGAAAAVELWESSTASAPARRLVRVAVAATLAAATLVPMRSYPDQLAYFNPISGDRPELILVDSNLDWGQDLYRLGTTMKRMHIDSVAVAYYGSASFEAAGVRHARPLAAAERPTGWVAASQTMLAGVAGDGAYEWLNELQPVGRVGSSLVLYYIPPRRRHR